MEEFLGKIEISDEIKEILLSARSITFCLYFYDLYNITVEGMENDTNESFLFC